MNGFAPGALREGLLVRHELFALDEMVAARRGVRMPAQLDWTVATLGDVCHYVTVGLEHRQP